MHATITKKQKRLLIFATVAAILAYLANLLADNPYTHRALRQYINAQVKTHTNLTLDFKALKARAMPPGIDLYGISLAPLATDGTPGQESLMAASRIEARLSLWSLFTGELRLGLIEITDLQLVWPPPANFPGFLKNPPPTPAHPEAPIWPPPFPLPIRDVKLNNARIFVEAGGYTMAATGLDLELDYDSWSELQLQLDAGSVDVAQGPVSLIESTSISVAVETNGDRFTASRIKAKGERLDVGATMLGKIVTAKRTNILEGIELSADGEAIGDFSLLGSFLDISDTRGPVNGKFHTDVFIPIASKSAPKFQLNGEGQLNGAVIGGFKLHNSKGKFDINMERIAFPVIDVIVGDTQVGVANGEIKFNSAIDFDFKAKTQRLHLMDLLNTFNVDFDVFDLELTTDNLHVRGKGDPFVLNASAAVLAHDITLPATPYERTRFPTSPSCTLELNLAVTVKGLDFGGTAGHCFNPTSGHAKSDPAPKNSGVSPPAPAAGDATDLSKITAAGMIWFDEKKGIDLSVHSPELNIAISQHFATIPLGGKGQLDLRVVGPYDAVLIKAGAMIGEAKINEMPLGEITGNVIVAADHVAWNNVKIQPGSGGQLELPQGQLLIEGLSVQTKIIGREVLPTTIEEWLRPYGVNNMLFGISRLAGEVEGPLMHPFAWRGNIAAEMADATFNDLVLFDRLQFVTAANANSISIEGATYELGAYAANVNASITRRVPFNLAEAADTDDSMVALGLHRDDEIAIKISPAISDQTSQAASQPNGIETKPDHLQRLPVVGEILKEAGIRGQINATAKLRGTFSSLQGTVEGSIDALSVFGAKLAPIAFQTFLKDEKIDTVISHAGTALEGRFSLDLAKKNLPYEWYFNFNRMDLRSFGTEYFYKDPRNFAYLTADWHMRGHLLDWWKSTGEIKLDDLQVKFFHDAGGQVKSTQIRNEQPVKLLMTSSGWKFADEQDLFLSGRYIHARVSMPDTAPPARLGIKLETVVDLALIKDLSSLIESATGKVRIQGEISGPVTNIKSSFEITDLKANPFIASSWEPLSLGLADFRPPLRNIRLKANVKDGKLIVESLTANKGAGTIAATGALNLIERTGDNADRGGTVDDSRLDITFRDASVIYPVAVLKSFESAVSGNVSLSGSGLPWRLAGDINITKARSTREVDIRDEIIAAFRRQNANRLVAEKPTVILDLNVNADNSINISNRNIQALLSTNLQITGNDIVPVISGQVEVERGKFIYKRDFTMTRGLITFDDPVKTDPTLDILAVSEVKNYRVYIAISGRASNPVVDFSIDPPTNRSGAPISKVDIFVLLSRGELPDESRASGEAADAAALEFVNVAAGMFEEPVERLFERSGQNIVRQVYIDIYSSPEGAPIPRFNLPLNLGRDLDVVLRVDQSSFGLTSEYSLHDAVSLSGGFTRQSQGTTGTEKTKSVPADTGVDLKFRFAFP